MEIKICGMKDPGNITSVAAFHPDYMGFIFYDRSPRFAGSLDPHTLKGLSPGTKRVGVFVNAGEEYIREQVRKYSLDRVQLHGDETPAFCSGIRRRIPVIKAFGIRGTADFERLAEYAESCDYFLFDTKTPQRGGSGKQFDHRLLTAYQETIPYFLSGGIGPEDAAQLQQFNDPRCISIDINSRFETEPGVKDAEAVGKFIQAIKG